MIKRKNLSQVLSVCFCLALFFSASSTISFAQAATKPAPKPVPTAAKTPAVPFTLEKPPDWILSQAGECDTLTLFLRSPTEPMLQLFFFPRFGPVYMTQEQKTNDLQFEVMSGQKMSRLDMPVVDPLTPENFARFLPQVLQMKTVREFLPERPKVRVVEPITTISQKKTLDYQDSQTAILRVLFVQDNRLGEALISLTTVPSPEFRNAPGGGIGMGYMLYGLTAPKGELSAQLPTLLAAGRSFKLGPEYEKKCRKDRAEDLPTLLPDGQSLKAVLDAMALVWEKRSPAEDMLTEKKADSLRGVERLYRPATGDVYEFPLGFIASYLAQPASYTLSDLRPLPDEPALWLKTPLNGSQAVTKK